MQNSPSQSYNHVIGMRLSLVIGTRLGTQSFSVDAAPCKCPWLIFW